MIIALSSCKMKAEQKSLTSTFDVVDSMIVEGDYKGALKELKKAEKMAYDSWSYIGIYKRYSKMGEDKKSEKLIKKALKKNPKNQELLAVYVNFLLRHGRVDEGAKKAEDLRGGRYGSLYSEAVLKIERRTHSPVEEPEYYKDPKFYEIYLDAYKSSYNPIWIRNCAIYNLWNGYYENAASLNPVHYADANDAYFWAQVLFDGSRFYEAAEAIDVSRIYLSTKPLLNSAKAKQPTEIQLSSLESDAYIAVAELDKADEARQNVINQLQDIQYISNDEEALLKTLTTNSAIYAFDKNNDASAVTILSYIVDRWPSYVEGLSLYADYAYESNQMREEDSEIKALRELGLATLEMERYDSRQKIPLQKAVEKIDAALEKERNPFLSIIKLNLKYKMDPVYDVKQRNGDLWKMLEDNYSEEEKFNALLAEFAFSYLLRTGQFDDAFELFYKHIMTTYHFSLDEDFWVQIVQHLPEFDSKMCEFAAIFAAKKDVYDETIRINEYCVYESGGLLFGGMISPYVSNQTCMNLADIYYSIGKKDKSIDLYVKTAERETNDYIRSEIYYRVAAVYEATGDIKNALRSADYALSIYPGNARAQLLKSRHSSIRLQQ